MSKKPKETKEQKAVHKLEKQIESEVGTEAEVELKKHRAGLRSVAIFEFAKGFVVLAVGLGLFTLIGKDLDLVAERICHFMHLNPAHRYPQIFIEAAGNVTDTNIVWLALGALLYSGMRLAEAYGLWYGYTWAEWLAIISGGAYLPVELYELWRHLTWIKVVITCGNILLVIYLVYVRSQSMRRGSTHLE